MIAFIAFLSIAVITLTTICGVLLLRINELNIMVVRLEAQTLEYVGTLTTRMNSIKPLIELRPEDALDVH